MFSRLSRLRKLVSIIVSFGILALAFSYVDTEKAIGAVSHVEAKTFFFMVSIFLVNIILVNLRLQKLLAFFGQQLSFEILLRATLLSFLGSLLLGSFFGQAMGRQAALRDYNVPPETISAITTIERIITVLIGGLLCLGGFFWIFKASEFWSLLNKTNIASLAYTIPLCLGLILFADSQKNRSGRTFWTLFSFKKIWEFIKIIGVSCASQFLTFIAFIIITLEVAPNTELFALIAAITIIVFAASIPISINGWGVRELTSIAILGEIGISAASALVISVSVGICANISFAAVLPYLLKKARHTKARAVLALHHPNKKTVQSLNYFIITLTSVLILAQITIRPFSVDFSFNLADPVVLMTLSSLVITTITAKTLPKWSVPKLNLFIALFSLVLVFGLLKGYTSVGFTEWAFVGKALGWLVLIAYMLFGFFTVNQFRHVGILRVTEAMILSLSAIIFVRICSEAIFLMGIISTPLTDLGQFTGLVTNRNAFAFQLLICSALFMAYAPVLSAKQIFGRGHKIMNRFVFFEVLHGLIILGIYLTGSRAGILSWLFVTSGFMFAGVLKTRVVLHSVGYALVILLISKLGLFLLTQSGTVVTETVFLKPVFSGGESNSLRWDTISRGIEMWASNPIFGAGLGVFIETNTSNYQRPTVIHSTPVWVLAELGLIGFTLLVLTSFNIIKSAFLFDIKKPKNACILIIMSHFAIFGLVHEIFYQRIFWLAIGLCLAVPFYKRKSLKSKLAL